MATFAGTRRTYHTDKHLASALNPDAIVLTARHLSWLPISGMVILSLGLLECLDAALAKETRDFLQNLQVGVHASFGFECSSFLFREARASPSQLSILRLETSKI